MSRVAGYNTESTPKMLMWTVGLFMVWVCAFAWAILQGYSRFILGYHSWNQILYGWQLGVWLACVFHVLLREMIY